MKRLAFFCILSKKMKDNAIKIIDRLETADGKTKSTRLILNNFFKGKDSVLIIGSSKNKNIKKSVANLEKIGALGSLSLNAYDLMRFKNILIEKEAVKEIAAHYHK